MDCEQQRIDPTLRSIKDVWWPQMMLYYINNFDCGALQLGQSATDQQTLSTVDHVSYSLVQSCQQY